MRVGAPPGALGFIADQRALGLSRSRCRPGLASTVPTAPPARHSSALGATTAITLMRIQLGSRMLTSGRPNDAGNWIGCRLPQPNTLLTHTATTISTNPSRCIRRRITHRGHRIRSRRRESLTILLNSSRHALSGDSTHHAVMIEQLRRPVRHTQMKHIPQDRARSLG